MILVVAEKPSVGASISHVLGAGQRGTGYNSGNGYAVTWCVGHLGGRGLYAYHAA